MTDGAIIALVVGIISFVITLISCTFYLATKLEAIHSLAKTTSKAYEKHEEECTARWIRNDERLDNYNRQLGELAKIYFNVSQGKVTNS